MMEDPPSSLHRRRRCHFCFCYPLAQGGACPLLLRLLLLMVFKVLLLLPSCGWLRCCSTMPSSTTHQRRQLLRFRATAACVSPSSREVVRHRAGVRRGLRNGIKSPLPYGSYICFKSRKLGLMECLSLVFVLSL